MMMNIIAILWFVGLVAGLGFYIITRKVFPRGSKKAAMTAAVLLTLLLVGILATVTAFTPVG